MRNIETINKHLINEQSSIDKDISGTPEIYRKIRIKKKSIADFVYESIKRSRKGISFVMIQEKTGFSRRQVANAIYKLKKKEKIRAVRRGVYKGSGRSHK